MIWIVKFPAKKEIFANSGMRTFQGVNGWTLDYVQTGFASSNIVLVMCFVNKGCQLKHSELYVLCQSQNRQEYELQKRAQLIMGKVTDPLRKFCKCPLRKLCQCHDINSEIPCKKRDICKLRIMCRQVLQVQT